MKSRWENVLTSVKAIMKRPSQRVPRDAFVGCHAALHYMCLKSIQNDIGSADFFYLAFTGYNNKEHMSAIAKVRSVRHWSFSFNCMPFTALHLSGPQSELCCASSQLVETQCPAITRGCSSHGDRENTRLSQLFTIEIFLFTRRIILIRWASCRAIYATTPSVHHVVKTRVAQ